MKSRTVILLGVGFLLAGGVVISLGIRHSVLSRIGPEYVFALSKTPQFLTGEFSLAEARETLARDGLDIALWQEAGGSRQITSNRAVLMFTNGAASTRFVSIVLDGSRVVCQTSIGK